MISTDVKNKRTQRSDWRGYLFYRKEVLKTTWALRLSIAFLLLLVAFSTKSAWSVSIGEGLTCLEHAPKSDALLIENFDPEYLVFERTAALEKAGVASRVLVPVQAGAFGRPNGVSEGVAAVMARAAWIPSYELIPVTEVEPITLNAVKEIRDYLVKEHIRSVVVVTDGFRSRRSLLIYSYVLKQANVDVGCVPVFGLKTIHNWTDSWHGIQEVLLQSVKLGYYRFYVLPFVA